MDFQILVSNLTNPTLLFFVLGVVAVAIKSDLEIPASSSKFIALYLLFAIGFKGGQELASSGFNDEIIYALLFSILVSAVIPIYSFFVLKNRLGVSNAGAVAATYGSVSAVTFAHQLYLHGHMVAIMALMESPAIIVGLLLISIYKLDNTPALRRENVLIHSFTNGSVLLILGSLLIGYVADAKQAEGIKPFTNDLFKGFLAIFLLDMGITSGKKLKAFFSFGWIPLVFAFITPLVNGSLTAYISAMVTSDPSNRFMFSILAASASYIAVPAAIKISAPQANPGLFLPMALAVTFPVNITIGMPLYLMIVQHT